MNMCSAAFQWKRTESEANRIWKGMLWRGFKKVLTDRFETFIQSLSPSSVKDILSRLWWIVVQSDVEYAELCWAMVEAVCGAWLIMPWYGVEGPHRNVAWTTMMALMDHAVWGTIFMGIGMARIFGLVAQVYRVRLVSCMLGLLCWIFTAVCIGHDEWHAMVFPIAVVCAIGSGIGYWRIEYSRIREKQRGFITDSEYDKSR